MAYIGTSPSNGVRRVFDYTATAGQDTFQSTDNNGQSLIYTDSAYIDVYQNGILLLPSDYVATSGTTVVLDVPAALEDTVQIVAYDVFSVADTVSASDGGAFAGNVGIGGTLGVTGVPTFTGRSVHSGGITVANDGQIGSVGNADAMIISSGGVVTLPKIPCCYVQLTTSNAQDTSNPYTLINTDIRFDKLVLNQGSCYSESNGRFTVPVAGVYEVKFMLLSSDNTTTDHNIKIFKNGASVAKAFNSVDSNYVQRTTFYLSDCAVGDYFTVQLTSGDIYISADGQLSAFSVKLVG